MLRPLGYRIQSTHVLKHLGAGVASWNIQQYEFVSDNHEIILKEKKSNLQFSVIFYHFHDVRIIEKLLISLKAMIDIKFNGRWSLISQIESAIEISKLSFSERILKRFGL